MSKGTDPIQIRCAKTADAAEIARLTSELGYAATTEEIARRLNLLLSHTGHFITVAPTKHARLLGWIAAERRILLESGERVEIVGLVVSANAWRSGVGRALVSAAEAWAAGLGIAKITVRSNIDRAASHPFYEIMGYTRKKTQHVYVKTLITR